MVTGIYGTNPLNANSKIGSRYYARCVRVAPTHVANERAERRTHSHTKIVDMGIAYVEMEGENVSVCGRVPPVGGIIVPEATNYPDDPSTTKTTKTTGQA